ncbi:MAG TPA: hypothetical protein VIV58_37590, partial [Kofleriaceae bacterium]
ATTTKNLTSVTCTPAGDVYAIDDAGAVHDLRGHAATPSADPDKAAAAKVKLPGSVDYGRAQIEAVARDGQRVYALGRYMAISNSLEDDYAYLLRSDDGGATWTVVWRGPNVGPMGMGHHKEPDVGAALAVASSSVVLAAIDGAVLISSDHGKTFVRHAAARAPLAALWASPAGRLYGVGHRGEIVISTDGGKTFEATHAGDADLAAITGCGDEIWIVGARGVVLEHRSR